MLINISINFVTSPRGISQSSFFAPPMGAKFLGFMEQARLDIFPYFPIFNHQKCYISFLVTQEPKNSKFQFF